MVGVALTGCMKNEVYVPKCETPISFEVANYVAQTRAEGTFATTETFGVNAWSTGNGASTVQIMSDEVVSYDNVNNQWAPSKTYYWPINGTVDFIAYYPTSVKPTIVYDYAGADKYTYTNYTVGDVDLMYADKAIRYSQNVTSYNGFTGVPTLFRHALAKVNFKVQNALPVDGIYSYDIKVNSITLNAYNTGSVTLDNTGATAATRGTWSVENNVWTPSGDIVGIDTWSANVTLSDGNAVAYDATRLQYVLPQTLDASKQNVVVNYTVTQYQTIKDPITNNDVKTTIAVDTYTKTAYLYSSETGANNRWEMNKNITYTISLQYNGNPILFAPAVEEWVDADGSPVTIL